MIVNAEELWIEAGEAAEALRLQLESLVEEWMDTGKFFGEGHPAGIAYLNCSAHLRAVIRNHCKGANLDGES